MSLTEIIAWAVGIIAVIFIMVSNVLARKAYVKQNKKLEKRSRLFETIGFSLAFFVFGMGIRVLIFG